jgi:hypothetical protein
MMMPKALCGLLVGLALVGNGGPRTNAEKTANDIAFERLKKLVGDWQIASPRSETDKSAVALRYHLTAAGTVLVETDFPGTDKEMMTMYYRDGDQLLLTHYCGCGNQPHMRARAGQNASEIIFDFDGGTNLNPNKGFHMHDAVLRFTDDNHMHAEWQAFLDGKPAQKHSFDLVRKQ